MNISFNCIATFHRPSKLFYSRKLWSIYIRDSYFEFEHDFDSSNRPAVPVALKTSDFDELRWNINVKYLTNSEVEFVICSFLQFQISETRIIMLGWKIDLVKDWHVNNSSAVTYTNTDKSQTDVQIRLRRLPTLEIFNAPLRIVLDLNWMLDHLKHVLMSISRKLRQQCNTKSLNRVIFLKNGRFLGLIFYDTIDVECGAS